ncbi:MAG: hypothetical protein RJB38_1417 [Pseudomonadota bacterium]|jgi:hypothetical protein
MSKCVSTLETEKRQSSRTTSTNAYRGALTAALIIPLFLASGCRVGGEVRGKASSTASAIQTGSFSISQFQGAPPAQWRLDPDDRVYSKSRNLVFSGTCSATVSKLQVFQGASALSGPAPCTAGAFSLSLTTASDDAFSLDIRARDLSDQLTLDSKSLVVVVDTIPPAAPVLTSHVSPTIALTTENEPIEGALATDTVSITASDNRSITVNLGTHEFSYTAGLSSGGTKLVQLYAFDFAGNSSAPLSLDLSFNATMKLLALQFGAVHSGAPLASTGASSGSLESVSLHPWSKPGTAPKVSQSGTAWLTTGITRMAADGQFDE